MGDIMGGAVAARPKGMGQKKQNGPARPEPEIDTSAIDTQSRVLKVQKQIQQTKKTDLDILHEIGDLLSQVPRKRRLKIMEFLARVL